jgi:hypothetical protein
MRPGLLLVALLAASIIGLTQGYYILVASHSGNYNISTSLPAWCRSDAPGNLTFVVAEDVAVPIQLTRCTEFAFDPTLVVAEGSTPSEIQNATLWIFADSTFALGRPFNASSALYTETFTSPSAGSWLRADAVETWTQGSQTFYVVTPRFHMMNVSMRGNMTYWVAMVINMDRRISPTDGSFNTVRWLETGTPSTRVGSPAFLRGVDRYGNMFRSFPALASWSNVTLVESVAMPFLGHTATMSETHQMSFTAFLGACYAPPSVIIPSSRNFTDLPSPTAYTIKAPAVTLPEVPAPAPHGVPSPSRRVPTPRGVQVPTPPMKQVPAPPVVETPSPPPLEPPSPVSAYPTPSQELAVPGADHVNGPAPPQVIVVSTNPFTNPWYVVPFILLALGVIVSVVVICILWARRYRTRVLNKKDYEGMPEDKTIEMEDGHVKLSEESSEGDSIEIQGQTRSFNPTLDPAQVVEERLAASLNNVPLGKK